MNTINERGEAKGSNSETKPGSSGKPQVKSASVPGEVYRSFLPAPVAEELTENKPLVPDYAYFGLGTEARQAESDGLLAAGARTVSWAQFVKANGPW